MNDLVAHEDIISTINRLIDAGKLPHLLLYGPPGTGKTSTVLACAHKLYGKHFASMVLELNASDDRGIEVVREKIKEFASTRIMFSSVTTASPGCAHGTDRSDLPHVFSPCTK